MEEPTSEVRLIYDKYFEYHKNIERLQCANATRAGKNATPLKRPAAREGDATETSDKFCAQCAIRREKQWKRRDRAGRKGECDIKYSIRWISDAAERQSTVYCDLIPANGR